MKHIFKRVIIIIAITSSFLFANKGIVDTSVLLIKKEPSLSSVKFGFYKMDNIIDIEKTVDGIDNDDKWYKTNRGYVRAQYVILEEDLPRFINPNEVDYDKYALQLIVYQSTVVESLQRLRKLLRNENNLFLEKSKNVFIIYLTNFESYDDAVIKKEFLSVSFPTSFITKIKNQSNYYNNNTVVKNSIKNIENEDDYLDESINLNDFKENFEEDLNIDDIKTNSKAKVISNKKVNKIIKEKKVEIAKKNIVEKKFEKTKKEESDIKQTFSQLIENVLLNMDK